MSTEREVFLAAANVSRETMDRFDGYATLIRQWSPRINLVAKGSLDHLWQRHIADSAQIFALAPENFSNWLDLGSGGGLPGAVIAILAAEKAPKARITLVESDQRKAVFLRTLARATGVGFSVIATRIEELEPHAADVVSARALAPLPRLLDYAKKHLVPGGTALFPKGARFAEELAIAKKTWSFRAEIVPSMTDKEAAILKIGEIERA